MAGITTIAVAAGASLGTLFLGGLFTKIGPWYEALRKPSWQPPGWAFAPVWTAIGVLAAWAGVVAWNHAGGGSGRTVVIVLFALNAVLNILWSVLFFTARRPDWALVEVVPLWLSVLALILAFLEDAPFASLLLVPYLVWVGIASVLNLTVVRLNRPFA